MNFKYAVFDMDGTLIKSMDYWDEVERKVVGDMCGIDLLNGEHSKFIYRNLEEMLTRAQEISGKTLDRKPAFEKMHLLMREHYKSSPIQPVDGAFEYLKMLKESGIKIAIATATPFEESKPYLERSGMLELVDCYVSTSQVGKNKYHPDVFDKAIELLGGNKEETVVFEDALYSLETLKKNGFRYVIIDDGIRSSVITDEIKNNSEHYIHSYKELMNS